MLNREMETIFFEFTSIYSSFELDFFEFGKMRKPVLIFETCGLGAIFAFEYGRLQFVIAVLY